MGKAKAQIRTFIAYELTAQCKEKLYLCYRSFKCPSMRFVPGENLHATILFLGQTRTDQIDYITKAIEELPLPPRPEVVGEVVSGFPSLSRPRVLWIGPEDSPSWAEEIHSWLHQKLKKKLNLNSSHRYRFHITFARTKRRPSQEELDQILSIGKELPMSLEIKAITLYQSTLTQPHPTYTPLYRRTWDQSNSGTPDT